MNHNWNISFALDRVEFKEEIPNFFNSRKNLECTKDTFEYFNLDTGVAFTYNFFPEDNVVFLSIDLKTSNSNTIREAINEIADFTNYFKLRITYPENVSRDETFKAKRFIQKWHRVKRDYLDFHYDYVYHAVPSEKIKNAWYWNYSCQWTSYFLKDLFEIPKINFFNHYGKAKTIAKVNLNKWSAVPEADYYHLQLTQNKWFFRTAGELTERVVCRKDMDDIFLKCRFLPFEKTPFYKLRPEDFRTQIKELFSHSEDKKFNTIESSKIIDKEIYEGHSIKKLEESTY